MPPVFLIGYRATGKTAVGEALSARLGFSFADTDRRVESAAGMSIAELFAQRGEPAFRAHERAALQRLLDECAIDPRHVIATGGGIVLAAGNRNALRKAGTVVWLSARVETILERLSADGRTAATRPPLHGESVTGEVEEILATRLPLYRETAHIRVETDEKTISAIVEEISRRL